MKMKFTNSRDGVPRHNLKIEVRVGTKELAQAFVADTYNDHYHADMDDSILEYAKSISVRKIVAHAKNAITIDGLTLIDDRIYNNDLYESVDRVEALLNERLLEVPQHA